MKVFLIFLMQLFYLGLYSQYNLIGKIITNETNTFENCRIGITGTSKVIVPDKNGFFKIHNIAQKNIEIQCFCDGYEATKKNLDLSNKDTIKIYLNANISELEDVEAIGTIKEIKKSENPILTEIYDKKHFAKNPSPSLIDMMDRMNGVRTQVNCNICGTGDIHLNGLEGAYTLIVLDGVPIVGGLSSVYGLSGIPSFMLDRIEITKGPASSVFGSEALGGVIHAFSKKSSNKFSLQIQNYTTSHAENNLDLGININLNKKISLLSSANVFYFNNFLDKNQDNFSDVPLQNRMSFFQKWNFQRKNNRVFNINYRFLQEKRWGGEKNWSRDFRGSDSIYAETIDINRAEFNLSYQLPFKEKILFIYHTNFHLQDSYYGTTKFYAKQLLNFAQLTWDKTISKHQILSGLNVRHTLYDDNTFLTELDSTNEILKTKLPGFFIQDLVKFGEKSKLLMSSRLDHYDKHGLIFTPRIAFSKQNKNKQFRIHFGSGFRVVNLFTEDHAALTGARKIEIKNDLKPEKSYSLTCSESIKKNIQSYELELDFAGFFTYFSNRILPDYISDVNKIIYNNIDGYGLNYGLNFDIKFEKNNHFSMILGLTAMQVDIFENNTKQKQLLTENFSGNWTFTYIFQKIPLSIDYTGNFIGPMLLPKNGNLDPRPEKSKTYSIQNIQFTYTINKKITLFFGVKNIFNWTPAKHIPFLIARTNDPFDKNVTFDNAGNAIATSTNPYALTFDPSYVYAANQGIRGFIGFRYHFN